MKYLHEALDIIEWVEENYPENLKFTPDKETLEKIGLYLHLNTMESYNMFILLFGILFYLAVLEYFVQEEDYLRCATMIKTIDEVNSTYGWNFPHSVEDELAKTWARLSPLQLLEKLSNGE